MAHVPEGTDWAEAPCSGQMLASVSPAEAYSRLKPGLDGPGLELIIRIPIVTGPLVLCVGAPWTWLSHLLSRVTFPALVAVLGSLELRGRGHGSRGEDRLVPSRAFPGFLACRRRPSCPAPPSPQGQGTECKGPL